MKPLYIFLFSLLIHPASAQLTDIVWQKSLGGTGSDFANDAAYDPLSQTYIIAGTTGSSDFDVSFNHGLNDAWLVRMDINGNILWEKTYGGSAYENIQDIIQTQDGNYIFAGSTASVDGDVSFNHGQSDIWIVKIDVDGNMLWERSLGGSSSELAYGICEAVNGDLLITGYSRSDDGDFEINYGSNDLFVMRLNANGDMIWTRTVGTSDDDIGYCVMQHSNGKIIAGGQMRIPGSSDAYILSLNDDGTIHDELFLGQAPGGVISDIVEKTNGNMLLFGDTYAWKRRNYIEHVMNTATDLLVMEIDASFNILWDNFFGGTHFEQGNAGLSFSDGSYLAVGHTSSKNNGEVQGNHLTDINPIDAWLIKVDPDQIPIWQRCLGGFSTENAEAIIEIAPDDYIIIATTTSPDGDVTGYHQDDICYCADYWIIRLQVPCTPTKYFIDHDDDGYGIENNYIYACDDTAGYSPYVGDCNDFNDMLYPGAPEFWNGVDDNCDGITEFPLNDQGQANDLLIFPVPTFDITHVYCAQEITSISMYDAKGALVLRANPGSGMFDIDLAPFAAGVYSLNMTGISGRQYQVLIERIN